MGHIELRRLPRSQSWRQVLELLAVSPLATESLSEAILEASQVELRRAAHSRSASFALWVLIRLLASSREPDFVANLADMGISTRNDVPLSYLMRQISVVLETGMRDREGQTLLSDISKQAVLQTLTENIQVQTSLIEDPVESIQRSLRGLSGPTGFSNLMRDFFSNYLHRILAFVVDKELNNVTGPGFALRHIDDQKVFEQALYQRTRDMTRILAEYARGWYSKHNWLTDFHIPEDDVHGFYAYALTKLCMDLPGVDDSYE